MLTWLAFWFAFRSSRETMWRKCAILGVIVGIVTAYFDWQNVHAELNQRLHPEYTIVLGNTPLMATAMLLDFAMGLFGVLSICWFGWLCRWCFIWSRSKPKTASIVVDNPIYGFLGRFGDFSWKLGLIVTCSVLVVTLAVVFYNNVIPLLAEKTLTFNPPRPQATTTPQVVPHYQTIPTATPYADLDLPTATPEVRRALPVPTPEVRRALPGDPSFHDGHWFHLGKNGRRTQEVPTSVTIQDGKWFHSAPAHSKTSDGISVGSYTRDKYGNYIEF